MGSTSAVRSGSAQLLERLETIVSGFNGYREIDDRRDDDARVRLEVCERLDRVQALLEDYLLDLSEDGWNPAVAGLDGFVRRLEDARDHVTGAADQYEEFFGRAPSDEKECAAVMDCDLSLLVELDTLSEHVEGLGGASFTPGYLRETLGGIDERVSAVELAVDARHRAVKGK